MTLGERMLAATAAQSPRAGEFLRRFGDAPLDSVLHALPPAPQDTVQPATDLLDTVWEHAAVHYGQDVATLAVAGLAATMTAPTANHFGIDTFADSVQGTLLYARSAAPGGVAVVLGFGSISMNNLTYPMGLRLYELAADGDTTPVRLPVLPNRVKRCTVLSAPGHRVEMVERALRRLHTMATGGLVSVAVAEHASAILREDFAAAEVLAKPDYRTQSVELNRRIWRRLFAAGRPACDLVQLPVEPICADLLERDFADPGSLAHRLLFTEPVRQRLLAGLDGQRACWHLAGLAGRWANRAGTAHPPCGTTFFWGISERGTRVPMALVEDSGVSLLAGVDDRGDPIVVDFQPDSVGEALRSGALVPSLLLCFVTLAFARGLVCLGGYYQADYLPVMRQVVAEAVLAEPGGVDLAALLGSVPADVCLAGVQPIVRETPDGLALPAGPVEIAAAGGLTDACLDRLGQVPARVATLAAFPDMFDHVARAAEFGDGWQRAIATENHQTLDRSVLRLVPR